MYTSFMLEQATVQVQQLQQIMIQLLRKSPFLKYLSLMEIHTQLLGSLKLTPEDYGYGLMIIQYFSKKR